MGTIRPAQPVDEDRILELWELLREHHDAVQPVQPSGWTRDPDVTRSFIRQAREDPEHCQIFVAVVDDAIQGFVKVSRRTEFYPHSDIDILSVDSRRVTKRVTRRFSEQQAESG